MKKPVMTDNIEVLTHSSIRIICTYGTIYIDPYQVSGGVELNECVILT